VIEPSNDPGLISRAVALGVAGVAGVARLTPGAGVEAATYFAGGKTLGVVVQKDQVRVHVVLSQLPIAQVTERVREAAQRVLRALGAERPVEVVVEDLEVEQLPRIRRSVPLSQPKARTPRVR
jgi:hypothetical protein